MVNNTEKNTQKKSLPIFNMAFIMAIEHIGRLFKNYPEAKWLKKELCSPSYDNINFQYKNNVFSVLIDIQDTHGRSFLPQNYINRQLYASNKYNMIPCKFPVIINDTINKAIPSLELKSDGWNLLHTQSNQIIEPQNIASEDKVEMNAWEVRYLELQCAVEYLKSQNYTVKSYQDTVENNPQIWCEDSEHNIFWVLIDSKKDKNQENNKEHNITETIKNYNNFDGYCIELSITNGKTKKGKIYRSNTPKVHISKFEQIYEKSKYSDAQYENIRKENIYDLIMESIKQNNQSNNPKRTCVFPIPNYPDLLLRIPNVILQNMNLIRKDLTLVPMQYKNNILSKKCFGLPLYHIDVSDSEPAKTGYVTPKDVVFLNGIKTGLSILRKAAGKPVQDRYLFYFQTMIGLTEHRVDFHEFSKIIEINVKYGKDAVVKALDSIKQGVYTLPENMLADGSIEYNFKETADFYAFYTLCVKEFLNTLNFLAQMPIEAYQRAVDNIISEKEFVFDFYNPSNVFIDYENKEFNFIDFIFEEKFVTKKNFKEQILYFRNALYGVYTANLIQPEDVLFYDEDNATFEKYAKIITDKINECVPEELRIEKIRSH